MTQNTTTKITENEIELLAIELFEGLGYDYIHAPGIAPDGDQPERQRYNEVVLVSRLEQAIAKINPDIPTALQQEAVKEVLRIHSPELLTNNENFHSLITEGVTISRQDEGNERGDKVWCDKK